MPGWSWMTLGDGVLLVLQTQTRHSRVMSDDILLRADTAEAPRASVAIWNGMMCVHSTYLAASSTILCFFTSLSIHVFHINTSEYCDCGEHDPS